MQDNRSNNYHSVIGMWLPASRNVHLRDPIGFSIKECFYASTSRRFYDVDSGILKYIRGVEFNAEKRMPLPVWIVCFKSSIGLGNEIKTDKITINPASINMIKDQLKRKRRVEEEEEEQNERDPQGGEGDTQVKKKQRLLSEETNL